MPAAISTSQITTTYTGASVTPSATTLNLSADNNNVATYTVTNADGKTKVYTLKVEFASFKVNIDQNGLEGVSTYGVEVYYKNTFPGSGQNLSNNNENIVHTIQVNNIAEQNISQKTYKHSTYLTTGTTTYAVLYFKNAQGDTLSERLVKIDPLAKTVTVSAPVLTENYLLAYIAMPQQRSDPYSTILVQNSSGGGSSWTSFAYLDIGPSTTYTELEKSFWVVLKIANNQNSTIRCSWPGIPPVTAYPDGGKVMDFSVHKVNKLSFTLNR